MPFYFFLESVDNGDFHFYLGHADKIKESFQGRSKERLQCRNKKSLQADTSKPVSLHLRTGTRHAKGPSLWDTTWGKPQVNLMMSLSSRITTARRWRNIAFLRFLKRTFSENNLLCVELPEWKCFTEAFLVRKMRRAILRSAHLFRLLRFQ